ncbi:hypothetical protein PINS_up021392 [Pythium insidiosum]|nr:hypothetical protein PINS_up021392 [Pythium insidiosum]
MTSEDLVSNRTAPLTRDQFFEFIAWRHDRNVAKESGQPFDNTSASAVAFDAQLAAATLRQQVSLTDNLLIQVKGTVIGSSRSSAVTEDRSLDDTSLMTAPPTTGSRVIPKDERRSNRSEMSVRATSSARRIAMADDVIAAVSMALATTVLVAVMDRRTEEA